jgi:hypothetical protein
LPAYPIGGTLCVMRPLRYSINVTLDGCCDHRAIDPKYVVSSTLDRVDWNAELVLGDLGKAVQQLKRESGKGLLTGGVKLPLALAELGLIDEYEFVVQPRLAGHGWSLARGRWRCGTSREGSHRACGLLLRRVAFSRRRRFPLKTTARHRLNADRL